MEKPKPSNRSRSGQMTKRNEKSLYQKSDKKLSPGVRKFIITTVYCLVVTFAIVGIIVIFLLINKAVARKAFKKKQEEAEKELNEYAEWMDSNQKEYNRIMQEATLSSVTSPPVPIFSQPAVSIPTILPPSKKTDQTEITKKQTTIENVPKSRPKKDKSEPEIPLRKPTKIEAQEKKGRSKTEKKSTERDNKPPKSELYTKMKRTKQSKSSMLTMNVDDESSKESIIKIMELEQWIDPEVLEQLKKIEKKDNNFRSFMESIQDLHKKSLFSESQKTKIIKNRASSLVEDFVKSYMDTNPDFVGYLIDNGAIEMDKEDESFFFAEDDSFLLKKYEEFLVAPKTVAKPTQISKEETITEPPVTVEIKVENVEKKEETTNENATSTDPLPAQIVNNVPFFQIPTVRLRAESAQPPQGFVTIQSGSFPTGIQMNGIPIVIQGNVRFEDMIRELSSTMDTVTTSQEEVNTPSRIESLDDEDVPAMVTESKTDQDISITEYLNEQRKAMNAPSVETLSSLEENMPSPESGNNSNSPATKNSSQETAEITLTKEESFLEVSKLESVD